MSTELIRLAQSKGAKLYASVSGGKDGDAMVQALVANKFSIAGLVHADLGRVEWAESLPQCQKCSDEYDIPLHVIKRKDGLGLLEYWQRRMRMLQGTGKPFWSSSNARYCTSDLKRAPINVFFTSTNESLIISCEGIRSDESKQRAKKQALSIRSNSSSYYKGMTVEEALLNYKPKYKLFLNWYPIFNFTLENVLATKNQTIETLALARRLYKQNGIVPNWWDFHPAYAYGNDRVSCKFCVLGSLNDLQNGADNDPELLDILIDMEIESDATFKDGWSLTELKPNQK
jgi:3'-phosphoadenosine 5'-phosphosulfate sulfotransferase (PAPS reductase)/FAD synthetase